MTCAVTYVTPVYNRDMKTLMLLPLLVLLSAPASPQDVPGDYSESSSRWAARVTIKTQC